MSVLDRVIVPLVTPFTDDTTSISEVRTARLVRHHIDQGAAGFVVCTEAGEVFSLSHSERKQVLEWVIRDTHGLSVYVNVSSNTTANVIDLAQHAGRHGAKGAIVGLPTHTPLTPEESAAFVASVRRHSNVPVTFLRVPVPDDEGLGLIQSQSFEAAGLGPLALYKDIASEELMIEGEAITPLGVFGAHRAHRIALSWIELQADVKSVFARGRSHRVGKAVLATESVDMGHTRGPVLDLDPAGLKIVESILAKLSDGLS